MISLKYLEETTNSSKDSSTSIKDIEDVTKNIKEENRKIDIENLDKFLDSALKMASNENAIDVFLAMLEALNIFNDFNKDIVESYRKKAEQRKQNLKNNTPTHN